MTEISHALGRDALAGSSTLFHARVHVYPRREILDPQGKAIGAALSRLGFGEVDQVRAGKAFDLRLFAEDEEAGRLRIEAMCKELLANPITEDFSFEISPVESAETDGGLA